jgi:hypothetical protein
LHLASRLVQSHTSWGERRLPALHLRGIHTSQVCRRLQRSIMFSSHYVTTGARGCHLILTRRAAARAWQVPAGQGILTSPSLQQMHKQGPARPWMRYVDMWRGHVYGCSGCDTTSTCMLSRLPVVVAAPAAAPAGCGTWHVASTYEGSQ